MLQPCCTVNRDHAGGVVRSGSDLEVVELELESYSFTSEHEVALEPDRQQRRAALKKFAKGFPVVAYLEYHLGSLLQASILPQIPLSIDTFGEKTQNVPLCNVDMSDPVKWKETALGVAAYKDFADIINAHLDNGLSKNFLVARTVRLWKIAQPETIHHGRPTTIFGVLFRLITRHIARQLMSHWKKIYHEN